MKKVGKRNIKRDIILESVDLKERGAKSLESGGQRHLLYRARLGS